MDIETKEIDGKKISWLPDSEYEKLIGQLRLQLNGVFKPFMSYGLSVYVPGAKEAIIKLCEDFSLRTRGLDHPLDYYEVKNQVGFREE